MNNLTVDIGDDDDIRRDFISNDMKYVHPNLYLGKDSKMRNTFLHKQDTIAYLKLKKKHNIDFKPRKVLTLKQRIIFYLKYLTTTR